jgi:UDP-N-acetylglucosamine--N-acetylmuramyl-(pentapeptide) pyrophosphoryl-undecaprenol N-acetylglucosamine transferase
MFPAEALTRTLHDRGWRVVLATDSRGDQYAQNFPAEERLSLEAATFRTGDPIGMVRAGLRIGKGVGQANEAFARLKPSVVVGFGGYPSLPSLLAARGARIPTVIHEQNAVLGRVNRRLANGATAVACAFPTLLKASAKVKKRLHVVGNPVRPDIAALYDRPYVAPDQTIRVLVTGGSQGARLLSELVPHAMNMLSEDLRVRLRVEQQTRVESIDFARRTFAEAGVEAEIAPFFRNMSGRLGAAHMVIGRAGASTVSELAVAGMPSMLIPLKIAMDDHQTWNAKFLTDCGAAVALKEEGLSAERFAREFEAFVANSASLAERSAAARAAAIPNAAERLADLVESVARPIA